MQTQCAGVPASTALAPSCQAAGWPGVGGRPCRGSDILAQPCTVRSVGSDAEIHEGRWVDPQLGGRVHAIGGMWPHCEEGQSGMGRGCLTSQASLQPGGCTQPKRTLTLLGKTRGGGSLLWEDPGWGQPAGEGLWWGQPAGEGLGWTHPLLPTVWRRGLLQPRTPSCPPASARLGPNGPPALVPSPQLARLDAAPSMLVLTVPGPLPRCFAVASLAPSPRPAARWKHRPDVGTVARGGGEEVAGGCPPGE